LKVGRTTESGGPKSWGRWARPRLQNLGVTKGLFKGKSSKKGNAKGAKQKKKKNKKTDGADYRGRTDELVLFAWRHFGESSTG